ncbi:MAG: diguanylate cyclase domain-containing protein, partial [Nitrospinota bacterium]
MKKDYFISKDPSLGPGSVECHPLQVTDFNREFPDDARMFLVDGTFSDFALNVCQAIRLKSSPGVYLKPIVLVTSNPEDTLKHDGVFDGVLRFQEMSEFSFQKIVDLSISVNSKIEQLPSLSLKDTNIGLKVLRFLYVRSCSISPVRTILTGTGYSYPGIDFFFEGRDGSLFKVLDFLEGQSVISGSFFEKSHFCNQCHSAFLNFQEVCPHCKSADLQVEDLIHHFACAHVGASTEYKKGSKNICPKCDKELRHVGVDFDKPSIVYTCSPCGHTSQDPEITTTCFNCARKTSPENLLQLTVKKYSLTSLGKSAALHGMDSLFSAVLKKNMPTIPIDSFKSFLAVEIQRIKRYKKSTSTIIMVHFPDLNKIYLDFGSKSADIFFELSVALKAVFRESDMITSLTDSLFLSILVETPTEGADRALGRVHEHAEKLFKEKIGHPLKFCSRS